MSPGIEFDETMAGPFVLGESEPKIGSSRGESEDSRLAMHATVRIPDLQTFIADPDHWGKLEGTIEFPPLGNDLSATMGAFNLFSPTKDPQLKLMIYELGFSADGKPCYLAGQKRVRDDSGFDLWSDTTTLYTTLHEGLDRSGMVLGAGVLSLKIRDLADLLTTVRVTGTSSANEVAATLACFGAFFLGELWKIYGPEVLRRHTLE